LERLAREQSDFSPLIVSLADEYRRRGDWPKAEAAYLSVVSREPNLDAYRRLLSVYAERLPERALALIDAQFRVERPASANDHARAILSALRAEPEATTRIAVDAQRKLNNGSVQWRSQTWRLIASAALAIGRFDCAEALFRHALESAGPDADFEIYDGLFRALHERRNWRALVNECRRASAQSRSIPAEFFARHQAVALSRLDRIDEALAVLDRAIPDARRSALLSLRLCRLEVLTYAERFAEVESEAAEFLDQCRDPGEIRCIRRVLSSAHRLADDRAKAEAQLRQVLTRFPDDSPSMLELGSLLIDCNRNLPEAERLIRRALELDRREKKDSLDQEGDPAAYVDSLARLHFRRGQFSTARQLLEQAAKSADGQRDPDVWDHLGDVCERLGDRSAAVAAWSEARHWSAALRRTIHDHRAAEIAHKIEQLKQQE
jgi:tetratricopeptide (TPR) repeat protein